MQRVISKQILIPTLEGLESGGSWELEGLESGGSWRVLEWNDVVSSKLG